ncbi:MAG: PAS domain S-box protein, partial [Pseudomonadota bacterium]
MPRCAVLDGKLQENAILITGADQKINWVDPAFEALAGLPLSELRGQLLGSVLTPLIKADSLSRIQSAVDSDRAFACESFNRRDDGTAYWIECEISPMAKEDGAQTGFAVTLRETTDRRLNEISQKIEADILQMVVKRAPTQEILNSLCLLFEAVYPKAVCSIMIRDDDADGLKIRAAPTLPPDIADLLNGLVPGPTAGSCGTAVYRGEPVLIYDVSEDPTWADLQHVVEASGLCSCWSHPVILGDKGIVGSFAISSLENRRPNKAEVRLLQLGAYLAGFALQQEWELNRRNQSEVRFRDFAEAAMDWFWETDADNRLTYVSGQIESFTDLSKDQIIGSDRMELIAQIADKDSYDLAKRQVRDQMPFKDVEYQTTDKKRWVRVSGRPIYHKDGSFAGYRGTGRDVTGMRAAQAEVEKSERLMRCLTAAAIGQSRTLDQVMNEILRIGRQEMKFGVGAVALVDGTQFSLRAVQGASLASGMETGALSDLANSACGRIFA